MTDLSLSNHKLKTPDFKVSTRYFNVEHVPKWGRLGEVDDYFWKTPRETEVENIDEVTLTSPTIMPGIDEDTYDAVVKETALQDEAEDWDDFKDIGLTDPD